jgi:hypothetical protein
MAFLSLAQLRTRDWPTREKAIADLKRSGVKERGSDYELREFKPGHWQLMELTGDDAAQAAPEPEPESKAKAKGKAKHPSETAARTAISEATGFSIHFRVSPKKSLSETAGTLQDAREIAARFNVEYGKSGRRAMIYATFDDKRAPIPVPADYMSSVGAEAQPMRAAPAASAEPPKKAEAKKKAAKQSAPPKQEAAPAPTPTEDANDMTSLPATEGPFTFALADPTAQHSLAVDALAFSQKIGVRVAIYRAAQINGKPTRVIDGRKGGRRPTRTAVRTAGRTPRAPGTGKQARAIELLKREGGATAAELNKATDWPIAQRHINRLAKVSGMKIKQLGENKWRLT